MIKNKPDPPTWTDVADILKDRDSQAIVDRFEKNKFFKRPHDQKCKEAKFYNIIGDNSDGEEKGEVKKPVATYAFPEDDPIYDHHQLKKGILPHNMEHCVAKPSRKSKILE